MKITAFAFAVLAFALAACGGSSTPTDVPAADSSAMPAAADSAAAAAASAAPAAADAAK